MIPPLLPAVRAARRMRGFESRRDTKDERLRGGGSTELTFSPGVCVESATHSLNQQRLLLAFSSVSFVSECNRVVILQVPARS
ncbi:Hypothetical predicted protein [Pelobates cultripes]|uniref:Uncharacterized protein n=1 Tax=Pelobates cultripes TaxID=61616 RepID=A0AAD1SCG0_PELCU|nr:Hypothetical predicted protein [Pelobates cultripes]